MGSESAALLRGHSGVLWTGGSCTRVMLMAMAGRGGMVGTGGVGTFAESLDEPSLGRSAAGVAASHWASLKEPLTTTY